MAAAANATPLVALDAVVDRHRDHRARSRQGLGGRVRGAAARRRPARHGGAAASAGAAGRADPAGRQPDPRHRRRDGRRCAVVCERRRRDSRPRSTARWWSAIRSASTSRCSSASSRAPAWPGRRRARSTRGCWRRSPRPGLAGYSLESLAAWLGVAVGQRHSALGDAETTARIFLALLPKLRAVGIRTLAEAERACRAMTDVLDKPASRRLGRAGECPRPAPVEPIARRASTAIPTVTGSARS